MCGLAKVDFDCAVEAARKNFADAIGAPKIPNVTWDDVGGLDAGSYRVATPKQGSYKGSVSGVIKVS